MEIFHSLKEYEADFLRLKNERARPWVYASAAMTLNGKIRGSRSPFGGSLDRAWYKYLLFEAGTIVLGATTFREVGVQETTNYQGKRIVVFSDSLDLPLEAPAIQNDHPFVVYTHNRDHSKRQEIIDGGRRVDIRDLGNISPEEIIKNLGRERILVDGGGYIYTHFAPVIEDWFVTLVPRFSEKERPSLWIGQDESADLMPQSLLVSEEQERILFRFSKKR